MMNCACAFSQSELGKYFEWIIKDIIEGWGACDKVPSDFWYIDSFSSNKAVSKSSKFIFGIEAERNKTKQMNYSSLNHNANSVSYPLTSESSMNLQILKLVYLPGCILSIKI